MLRAEQRCDAVLQLVEGPRGEEHCREVLTARGVVAAALQKHTLEGFQARIERRVRGAALTSDLASEPRGLNGGGEQIVGLHRDDRALERHIWRQQIKFPRTLHHRNARKRVRAHLALPAGELILLGGELIHQRMAVFVRQYEPLGTVDQEFQWRAVFRRWNR